MDGKTPMNAKLTMDEVQCAIEYGDGLCVNCGTEQSCVEPDANNYKCEQCGEMAVFGAEEILFVYPDQISQ